MNTGKISIPYSESVTYIATTNFNEATAEETITTDKWYDIKVIYDLTGDVGSLDFFVDGRLVAENITPPNEKTKSSINERYNKGRFVSLKFKMRADVASTGAFTIKLYDADSSLSLIQYFNNSRLFFGTGNVYINGGATPLTTGQWYNYEVYLIWLIM